MALEFLNADTSDTVFDVFCGIGTISLILAENVKRVYGIEASAKAVSDANKNAAANGFTNTEFIVGAAEDMLPAICDTGILPDKMILNPPRKGCCYRLLETIGKIKPERIVYISCDPATLARDIKIMREFGYSLKKVQPVDIFAFTPHVETVALLEILY